MRLADVVGETIDVEAVRRSVADPSTGATVVFMGTTREVPSLEYEAYVDMAREQIAALAEQVVREHGCVAVACVHRVGVVPLGDPSVVVAASAAHRAEAFDGARALLDAVKAQAPIWKKEHYEDGDAAWVEGTLPQAPELARPSQAMLYRCTVDTPAPCAVARLASATAARLDASAMLASARPPSSGPRSSRSAGCRSSWPPPPADRGGTCSSRRRRR